jgi:hypothetical protein
MHNLNQVTPPVKLTIPGKYWDSQVYAGVLYLFGRSGEFITINWDHLVSDLPCPPELRVVADAALMGNHRLYETGARQLVTDPEIRPLLIDKFRRLASASADWEIGAHMRGRVRDNRLPFPHSDSEIHYHQLFIGATSGLYSRGTSDIGGRRGTVQLADAPALDIAAKFYTIAMASGSGGLLEVRLPGARHKRPAAEVSILSPMPCLACEWGFSSVIASGSESTAYLASFARIPEERHNEARRRYTRMFDRVIPEEEMFGEVAALPAKGGFTWGAREKIFRYSHGGIDVVRYSPANNKSPYPDFSSIGRIEVPLDHPDESVVSARVAPFGSVVERDESLLVLPTVGDPFVLQGEPVNWRVFPRSLDYVNHLHVIYDDRLEIWAFTHDYFADQGSKIAGLEVGLRDESG